MENLTMGKAFPTASRLALFKGIYDRTAIPAFAPDNRNEVATAYFDIRSYSKIGTHVITSRAIDGVITEDVAETIGQILGTIYNVNWNHFWDSYYGLDYNPIDNYDMVEETVDHTNRVRTPDLRRTNTGTIGTNATSSMSGENDIYGYDSNDGVPSDKTSSATTGQGTETRNLQSTEAGTDTNVKDQTVTVRRSGNIGATTTQFMLDSERETWKWNFYEAVFEDMDHELTLAIY